MFSDFGAQLEPLQGTSKWALSSAENRHPPTVLRVSTQGKVHCKQSTISFSTTFPRVEDDLCITLWTFKIPAAYEAWVHSLDPIKSLEHTKARGRIDFLLSRQDWTLLELVFSSDLEEAAVYSRKHEVITCAVPSYQWHMNCNEWKHLFCPSQCFSFKWISLHSWSEYMKVPNSHACPVLAANCCDAYTCAQLPIFLCFHTVWWTQGMISFQYGFQNPLCLLISYSVFYCLFPPQSIHAPDLLPTICGL